MKFYPLFFILFLIHCNKNVQNETKSVSVPVTENSDKNISQEKLLIDTNSKIINLLKTKDYQKISEYIDQEKGIRFSMYSYISNKDKSFSKSEFEKYIDSDEKFTFGQKDGSGADFIASLDDYFRNWVFKKDFSKAKINYQIVDGKGNTLNNIKEKYPDAITVENYMAGTVEYSYMDWNSLILIFEKIGNQYYLVGIANNQWTV